MILEYRCARMLNIGVKTLLIWIVEATLYRIERNIKTCRRCFRSKCKTTQIEIVTDRSFANNAKKDFHASSANGIVVLFLQFHPFLVDIACFCGWLVTRGHL